ncbi:MAG: hypothetical protein FWF76_01385 [Oscillospiraceae bacterium]|nr:hypothetical protein [Oscillospiraceae bacterium]
MSVIHFLNVGEGDCIWIKHNSGHNTVIDVSCAKKEIEKSIVAETYNLDRHSNLSGNYNQKAYPDNPITYLEKFDVKSVFRFILTHPDMDHMDGIKDFFEVFSPINFWDTDNNKVMDSSGWTKSKYNKDDWDFYQKNRERESSPKVLHLYTGSEGQYFNQSENGEGGGDGLHILAPTEDLISTANDTKDYNDCSYVILYKTSKFRILFAGDSSDKTWDYILANHSEDIENIDVLIAPHHGRKTGGNDEYLDVLNPKLSLLGNAKSENLAYNAWISRKLEHFTNNQAGNIILDVQSNKIRILFSNEIFSKKWEEYSYDSKLKAYCVGELT